MLNELKMKPSPLSPSPIEYVHQHLVDSFHETGGGGGGKVRVQRDERTGRVVECVRKTRLADLNVYCPKRQADFRVSVNIEQPGESLYAHIRRQSRLTYHDAVPQPQGTPSYTRKKDRIAYSHEEFTIDLTQVTSTSTHGAVRIYSSSAFLAQC
jgi:polynucleotide 5'-triphosphatase